METMFTPARVVAMLRRLHQLGYERLRLSAGISPTGLHWRYSIAQVDMFEADGFRLKGGHYPGVAFSTTGGDDPPFGWDGTEGLDAKQLATLFLERFPEVALAGRGGDAAYGAWFEALVESCGTDGAPIMFGEDIDVKVGGRIGIGKGRSVPLPPPLPGPT